MKIIRSNLLVYLTLALNESQKRDQSAFGGEFGERKSGHTQCLLIYIDGLTKGESITLIEG